MDIQDKRCFDIVSADEKIIGKFLEDIKNVVFVNGDNLLCFERETLLRDYINNEEKWYYECVISGDNIDKIFEDDLEADKIWKDLSSKSGIKETYNNIPFVSMPIGEEKVLVSRSEMKKSLQDMKQQVFHLNFIGKKNMVSHINAGFGSEFCQEGLNFYNISYCDGESCWDTKKSLKSEIQILKNKLDTEILDIKKAIKIMNKLHRSNTGDKLEIKNFLNKNGDRYFLFSKGFAGLGDIISLYTLKNNDKFIEDNFDDIDLESILELLLGLTGNFNPKLFKLLINKGIDINSEIYKNKIKLEERNVSFGSVVTGTEKKRLYEHYDKIIKFLKENEAK
jgi:hypothetical protein